MRKAIVAMLIVAAFVTVFLFVQQGRRGELVVSGFIEADEVRVGSRIGGRVAEVRAEEGKAFKPGEVLYRLDPFDLRERLAEARSMLAAAESDYARLKRGFREEEIAQARAKREQYSALLSKLEAGPRKQDVEAARQRVNIARAALDFAETEHARLTRLREQAQVASPREYDDAVRMLKTATGELAAAQQQLSMLEEGSRVEDIAEARSRLSEAAERLKLLEAGSRVEDIARGAAQADAARAAVGAIERQVAELTVVSPCACVVEAVDLQAGEIVAPNAPTISMLDVSRLWVRTYVPESRLGLVRVGSVLPVRVESAAGRRFRGRVTFIAREAEFTPRNVQTPEERSKQVFRMKVALEEGLEEIRAGMAADVLLGEAGGA